MLGCSNTIGDPRRESPADEGKQDELLQPLHGQTSRRAQLLAGHA